MKPTPTFLFLLLITFIGCKDSKTEKPDKKVENTEEIVVTKPRVSFTFDDGNTSDLAGFEFNEWNDMILSHLGKENLNTVFFVTGKNKLDQKGQFLLESWTEKGHKIANHSFTHPNFNAVKNTALIFKNELKKTASIISKFHNSIKLFRFPYLKEGHNPAKVDSIRNILAKYGYLNGYVTIDASDWYIDQRLRERIKKVGFENAEIQKFRDFYIGHIMERANFYENLSYGITKRHINHTLLLHHNLASALFLGDLIESFKEKGWELIDADNAYQDPIFENIPKSDFAGESLIYSLAKQSGKYNDSLRYPAEDSRYEKDKMNQLGL